MQNQFRGPFAQPGSLAQLFSLQLEVFVRHTFGELYHSGPMIFWISAWLVLVSAAFIFGINIFGYQLLWPSVPTAALFSFLTAAFLVASFIHQKEAYDYRRALKQFGEKELLHRWDPGEPKDFWLRLTDEESTIKRYLEPLPFLLIGAFLFLIISKVFGGYLLFCTLVMLWKSHQDHRIATNEVGENVDGFLNAEATAALMEEERRAIELALRNGRHRRRNGLKSGGGRRALPK